MTTTFPAGAPVLTKLDLTSPKTPALAPAPEPIPVIDADLAPQVILGNAAIISFAARGGDMEKVVGFFTGLVEKAPTDATALLDLALLRHIQVRREEAYRLQAEALRHERLFRVAGSPGREIPTRLRVLALVAPGDFMNNIQVEFLLDNSEIGLDVLYIVPGQPLPASVPEHDVLFCAVNESDENAPVLDRLAPILRHWPRPVVNDPKVMRGLSRSGVSALFADAQAVCAPEMRRVTRSDLRRLALGETGVEALLPGVDYPVLVRPVGSHCGDNFDKIDRAADLGAYLDKLDSSATDFFLGRFLDYRKPDGLYRKYRVVFIDRIPWLCHLAVSPQWKVHYVSAGMEETPAKRAEEEQAMLTFAHDFARRHREAFTLLCNRVPLDYFGIDCAELPDGRLLLFEIDSAMIIHAMDSPELYPYKAPQMGRVFAAFREFITQAAQRPAGLASPL